MAFEMCPAGEKFKEELIEDGTPDSPPEVMSEQFGASGLEKDSGVRMDHESLSASGLRRREGLGV